MWKKPTNLHIYRHKPYTRTEKGKVLLAYTHIALIHISYQIPFNDIRLVILPIFSIHILICVLFFCVGFLRRELDVCVICVGFSIHIRAMYKAVFFFFLIVLFGGEKFDDVRRNRNTPCTPNLFLQWLRSINITWFVYLYWSSTMAWINRRCNPLNSHLGIHFLSRHGWKLCYNQI